MRSEGCARALRPMTWAELNLAGDRCRPLREHGWCSLAICRSGWRQSRASLAPQSPRDSLPDRTPTFATSNSIAHMCKSVSESARRDENENEASPTPPDHRAPTRAACSCLPSHISEIIAKTQFFSGLLDPCPRCSGAWFPVAAPSYSARCRRRPTRLRRGRTRWPAAPTSQETIESGAADAMRGVSGNPRTTSTIMLARNRS
jgi:hypothetical protein